MTCFSAEGDMKVNAGQGVRIGDAAKLRCRHQKGGFHSVALLLLWLNFVMFFLPGSLIAQHILQIRQAVSDTADIRQLGLTTRFPGRQACLTYIDQIPQILAKKGYVTASIDSVVADSATTTIILFTGERFGWGKLSVNGITEKELENAGVVINREASRPFSASTMENWQQSILHWLGNNGYPFASVKLDSLVLEPQAAGGQLVSGVLQVNKGLAYTLDSFRVVGAARISDRFLHRYLDMPRQSIYRVDGFNDISPRLRELPFLTESKPWELRFGGNGAILDLYLEPKKSSQINVLLGLLPGTNAAGANKLQLTGEANLNLKNSLGNGETIGLNWQQLQVRSPRLNLLYQQPYLFGSAFGISTQFDLFKKDSSFLNLNGQFGLQYAVSARQTGKVFLQLLRTNLLDVDTNRIRQNLRLPSDMDLGLVNLGVDYELFTTNYRRNPRRGWELFSSVAAGTRTIRRNPAILDMKDPAFDFSSLYDTVDLKSYQFRLKARVAKFVPIGRQSTLQVLASGGWVESPSLYRNELFQLGGYKLMRGFDEESIFASRYLVSTLEYRYLVGMNSYFFGFADLGFTGNKSSMGSSRNGFFGAGLGLAFETAAGFFNLSLAAGKRDDTSFNLRQTKIHLGYVNYF